MCSKNEALIILREIYDQFNKAFPETIRDAYLYGSYARGDFDDESDVDILLTVDAPAENIWSYQAALSNLNSDLSLSHDVTVSATVKSKQIFDQYANSLPFYENVLKEGIAYAR